jgi:ribosomal protein L17
MLGTKNFGKKSLTEIKDLLHGMGLDFGMDFDEQGNPIPGSGGSRSRLKMRHLNAHRKLGRTSEHRKSLLRNLATSLINAEKEHIVTSVAKAKELRPYVEKVITLAKKAQHLEGDGRVLRGVHLRRQAARFFTPATAPLRASRAGFVETKARLRTLSKERLV